MSILHVAFSVFIYVIGIVLLSHLFEDILPSLCFRFIRDPNRIRSDIRYQTYGSMSFDLNTFVELLRYHHRFSRGKVDFISGILLHAAGGKRSRSFSNTILLIQRAYDIWIFLQFFQNCIVLVFIINGKLFSLTLCQFCCKNLILLKISIDNPEFLRLEVLDFVFPVADDLKCCRLYTAGAKSSPHFSPKQRADLISYQTIQHTACLLCIHQADIDRSRMFDRLLDRLGCDFIKHDPARSILIDPQ